MVSVGPDIGGWSVYGIIWRSYSVRQSKTSKAWHYSRDMVIASKLPRRYRRLYKWPRYSLWRWVLEKALPSIFCLFRRLCRKVCQVHLTWTCDMTLRLSNRVLIACIKLNGKHLCATCKTTHHQALRLGTKLHDQIWASHRRVDSTVEQLRVEAARRKIYQRGYLADGKAIDDVLQDSRTPIRVRLACGYPLVGD